MQTTDVRDSTVDLVTPALAPDAIGFVDARRGARSFDNVLNRIRLATTEIECRSSRRIRGQKDTVHRIGDINVVANWREVHDLYFRATRIQNLPHNERNEEVVVLAGTINVEDTEGDD